MTRAFRTKLLTSLLIAGLAPLRVHAQDETFSFEQTGDGEILITLQGQVPYCAYNLGAFVGTPTIAVTDSSVAVSSNIVEGECNPPPVVPPPQPFTLTVSAGLLSDGRYSVDWTYYDVSSPAFLPPQVFHSYFILNGGGLVVFANGFEGK